MRQLSCITLLALGVLIVGGGCSDDGLAEIFVVTVTNAWADQNNPDRSFNLNALTGEGTESGTFEGTEDINTANDFVSNNLVGSWGDNEIRFTVQRAVGEETYRAEVTQDNPTTLVFVSDAETLVLSRGDG